MFKILPFNRCMILKSKLKSELFLDLKNICNEILNNENLQVPYNSELVGSIEKEYSMPNNLELDKFLKSMANFYYYTNNETHNLNNLSNITIKSWINFQKKFEYNPVHFHSGNLSFVIWIQIPYDIKKEKNNKSSKFSRYNSVSDFYYVEPFQITNVTLSKESEGEIVMFSSDLKHGVHPFYSSDEYRISVAGNLSFCNDQNNSSIEYN